MPDTGPGWLADEDLADRVLGCLGKAQFEEPDVWDLIVKDSNRAAYNQILRALRKRGYSSTQIVQWDDGAEFQADLGLYWAMVKGGCTKDFDDTFINKLDRRAELETVNVTNGGELVIPVPFTTAKIGGGTLSNANDLFHLPR